MEKTPENGGVKASPLKRFVSRLLYGAPDEPELLEEVSASLPHIDVAGKLSLAGSSQIDHTNPERDLLMQKLERTPTQPIHSRLYSNGNESDFFSVEWLFDVAYRMQRAETVDSLLSITVTEIQQHLKADRVLIYQFQGENQGVVIAESMISGYTPSLGATLPVVAFGAEAQSDYQQHPFVFVGVTAEILTPHQSQLLEHFQVKTSASLAIVIDQKLWGLLVVQQCDQSRQWKEFELNRLQQVVRELRLNLQPVEARIQKQKQAENEKITARIIEKIHRSLDIASVFQTTTHEVRQQLKCDRVAVYRFNPDWSGEFVSESVGKNWIALVGLDLEADRLDTHLHETQNGRYRDQQAIAVDDIYKAGCSLRHLELLEVFEAKAYTIAPIFQGDTLWGLLAAYQNSGPRHWSPTDVELLVQVGRQFGLAIQQAEYLEQLRAQSEQRAKIAEQERFISNTVNRIRQSLDLQTTFNTTAREIRNFLQVDRVAIFKFSIESDYSTGATIAEDVQPGFVSALAVTVTDHCFNEGFAAQYQKGRVFATPDIYQAGLQSCYLDVLSQFQVRANLVVPLLRGEELWGLFCIHHCSEAREWKDTEIEFAKQIAAQLNIAIQQGEYVEQLQHQSQQLAEAAQREKTAKEKVQQEIIGLLSAVQPALEGDLTVRAPVTDTEVGTVADAYNNTLNSLRQIVTQMQAAASQVTHTSEANNLAITQLAIQAQDQLQMLKQAFKQVQMMASSTKQVEANAHQVEAALQQANRTVMAGDAAIDQTVDEMEDIRETVVETGKKLQRLSESSQKISKVVHLIGNFTTQTQLLALNAAIEATRAGEFGRGFGVVADEVRSLARQSAAAATEIEQLVQDIQISTADVATAMEVGIQQVASGTKVVNEARENLSAIVTATAEMSNLVNAITQSTQEQTQQCQSVTQAMTQAAEVASKTSQDAATISGAFQDLLATAQDLKAKGEQFKVD